MVLFVYTYVKTFQIVFCVQLIVCQLYLNKAVFKSKK